MTVEELVLKISGDSKGGEDAAKRVGDALKSAFEEPMSAVERIGTLLGGLLAGIGGLTAGIIELGDRGSKVNDVREAFMGFAKGINVDGAEALASLRAGSMGLISDFDLMKGATKAMSAGFQGNAADLGLVSAAAVILSRNVGNEGGTAGAYQTLTDALTTGRTKALAQLGVMVELKTAQAALKDETKDAGEQMSSAADLEMKRTAIMEALRHAVEQAGNEELTFHEKIQVAEVGVKNFTDDLSVAIATSPALNTALGAISSGMLGAFGSNQQAAIQTIIGYVNQFAIFLVEAAKVAVTGAEYMVGAYDGVKIIFLGVMTVITFLAEGVNKAFAAILEGASHLPVIGDTYKGMAADAKDLAIQTEGMRKSFQDQTTEAIDGGGKQMAAFEGTKETLGHLADTMREASEKGVTHDEVTKALTAHTQESKEAQDQFQKKIESVTKAMKELSTEILYAKANGTLTNEEFLKKFGESAVTVSTNARAMGLDVSKAVQDIADAFEAKKLSDLVEKDALKIRTLYDKIMKDAEEAVKKGLVAQNKAYEDNNKIASQVLDDHLKLLTQQEGDSLANRLDAIKEDVRKRKDQLAIHGSNYKYTLDEIEGHETAAIAAATEAWTTGGIKTKAQLQAEADHAKLIFETIKNDGEHTPQQIAAAWKAMVDANDAATGGWMADFHAVMAGVPGLITSALTGGGGLSGALKGLGSQLGSMLGNHVFGPDGFLSAIGNLIPGIGGALGAVVGPLTDMIGGFFNKVFGTAGRDAVIDFAKSLTGSTDLNQLHVFLQDKLGASAEQFWIKLTQGVGKNNPDQAKAVIAEINAALKGQTDKIAEANAAATEFGLTWKDMGDKARGAHLDDVAQSLLDKYKLLIDAGYEQVAVTDHMSQSVNDYLKDARTMGKEVPEAMRPMLQAMVDQGTLLDANGDKVTDLDKAGISWSKTMTQGFNDVTGAINHLSDVLLGLPGHAATAASGVNAALGTIKDPTVTVHYKDEGGPGGASTEEIPSFSNRAMEKVTSAGLAMLHPGDFVGVPPRGGLVPGGAVAAVLSAGVSGAPSITFEQGAIDASGSMFTDRQAMRELADIIEQHITEKFTGTMPVSPRL